MPRRQSCWKLVDFYCLNSGYRVWSQDQQQYHQEAQMHSLRPYLNILNQHLPLTYSSCPHPKRSYQKQMVQARILLWVQGDNKEPWRTTKAKAERWVKYRYNTEVSFLFLPWSCLDHARFVNSWKIRKWSSSLINRAHQGAKYTYGFYFYRKKNSIHSRRCNIQQMVLSDLMCWFSMKQLSRK